MNGKTAKFIRNFVEYDGTPEARQRYQGAKQLWKDTPRDKKPDLKEKFNDLTDAHAMLQESAKAS